MDRSDQTAERSDGDRCPQCAHEVGDAWLVCAWCGKQLAAAAELAAGTRLADGRYQILRVIGRGGFGITYDVGDRRLQRRVAMKELFPESAVRHGSLVLTPPHGRADFRAARERFLREARVLARFTHPGIVRVYEVFEEHGTAYLVMELLEGRTLIELLQQRGRPFDEPEVLDVAGRVAAALRPVHAVGVLHRDINPSNVMMTHHGRIVVIDFGLARDFDHEHTAGMTRVVTPGYAPLEQYRGEGRFGPSTDVYGLAATCYRLATAKVPSAAIERDGGAPLPSPHQLNPAISKEVSDAILDGLELQPGHRPQNLDAFLSRLGIGRLPEGPRSRLVDIVPPPTPDAPLSAADISPPPFAAVGGPRSGNSHEPATDEPLTDEPLTDETVIVARPRAARATAPVAAAPMPTPAPTPAPTPRVPGVVGPHPPGRRKVLVPLVAVALATASAAPVLVTAVVVVLVLPWIATRGDAVAHRLRAEHGVAPAWGERRLPPGALGVVRFGRNVVVSVARAAPVVGVGAVLLAGWYGLDRLIDAALPVELALRAVGLLVMGVVVTTARSTSRRFRTAIGLDDLVARWVPGGRTSERLVIAWIVATFVVAGALWLTPDPFPLP